MSNFTIILPSDHEALQLLEASKNVYYADLVNQYTQFCTERYLDATVGARISKEKEVNDIAKRFTDLRVYKNLKMFSDEFKSLHKSAEIMANHDFKELSKNECDRINSILNELANIDVPVRFVQSKKEFETIDGTSYTRLTITRKKRKADFKQAQRSFNEISSSLQSLTEYSEHLLSIFNKIQSVLTESSDGKDIVPYVDIVTSICTAMKPLLQNVDDSIKGLNFEHIRFDEEDFFTEKNALSKFKEACKEYLKQNEQYSKTEFDSDEVITTVAEQFEKFAHFDECCQIELRALLRNLQYSCKDTPSSVIQSNYGHRSETFILSYDPDHPLTKLHQWSISIPYILMEIPMAAVVFIVEKIKNTIVVKYQVTHHVSFNNDNKLPWYMGENLLLSPEYQAFCKEFEKNEEFVSSLDTGAFLIESLRQFCIENGILGYEYIDTVTGTVKFPGPVDAELRSFQGIITVEI